MSSRFQQPRCSVGFSRCAIAGTINSRPCDRPFTRISRYVTTAGCCVDCLASRNCKTSWPTPGPSLTWVDKRTRYEILSDRGTRTTPFVNDMISTTADLLARTLRLPTKQSRCLCVRLVCPRILRFRWGEGGENQWPVDHGLTSTVMHSVRPMVSSGVPKTCAPARSTYLYVITFDFLDGFNERRVKIAL